MRPDVAIVSPYPAPGRTHDGSSGVAAYTANLARDLSFNGANVVVVAPDEPTAPSSHRDGDVIVVSSGPRGPFALPRAVGIAADLRARVIHLQHEMFLFGGLSSIATLPMAVRSMRNHERGVVTTVHQVVDSELVSPEFLDVHRLRCPVGVARLAINAYQCIVASIGPIIVHEAGFRKQFPNAVVIPHGVEDRMSPPRAEARARLGLAGESRLVVLCFGFVAPYKGLESALAAAADVPDVLMVVAGGDHPRHGHEYADALQSRWGERARFTGWLSEGEIATWHAAADIALFYYPAPHSSSGAVAMALGYGTPVLASEALARVMGLSPELAVSLDRVELAERLRRLAADRSSLAEMRQATARMVAGRGWPEVARRHLEIYERVASGTAGRAPLAIDSASDQLEAV
ncbi:MAG TPA: glycosyltransferase [Acidimicrobiia bacterium]